MNPILRKLAFAAVILSTSITLAGVATGGPALAQATAPSASTSLPEVTVKALQQALKSQGITVETDGVLGDGTREAIRQYQSQHHLPVTGEPDKATLDKLGVATPQAAGAAAPGQPMGGPEMMQMMQRMMAQRGKAQDGMPGMKEQGPMPKAGA